MNTHIHDITDKPIPKLEPLLRHLLEKVAVFLIPLPLFMLFSGTIGIIENETPDSLANMGSMGSSFFNFMDMHALIIAGAFGVTFIIWFITRNIWNQSEDELYDEQSDLEKNDFDKTDRI